MHVKINVYFYHTVVCHLALPQLSERMKIVDVVGMRVFRDGECILTQVLSTFTVHYLYLITILLYFVLYHCRFHCISALLGG